MKVTKGLFTDCAEIDQPAGTYRFAKNIVDSNTLGGKENEDGFLELDNYTPYTAIGFIPMVRSIAVFSTNNVNSEIGVIEISADYSIYTYSTIYNNSSLNFNTTKPIKGVYRTDVNGERIIAWIDDTNVPRILNLDDLSGINDVNDLATFQTIGNPTLSSATINNTGGALKTGSIIPVTCYKNRDGSITKWFVHEKVFPIVDEPTTAAVNDMDGNEGGVVTGKSVTLNFTGCDTQFETLVIAYIESINGILRAYQVGEVINTSSVTYVLTGAETKTDITLDEILTPPTSYTTARAITSLNGRLIYANLTAEEIPDLQSTALNIRINYNRTSQSGVSNTSSNKDGGSPMFIPGEVYAFYLGVELNQGGWAYYHIPGRVSIAGETATINTEGLTYKKFQIEDTADAGGALTNMGYWENTNELYPDDPAFTGLIGLPVRHHRMPTLDYLVTTYHSGDTAMGTLNLIKLGIDVTNVSISAGIQAKIKRWKIFFAKKDSLNSLFLGSDLLQFGIPPDNNPSQRWGTGGNWTVDGNLSAGFPTSAVDTIRGHSHDLVLSSLGTLPTYARFNYKIARTNLNVAYTGFRSAGGLLAETTGHHANMVDFTDFTYAVRSGTGFIKRLDNFSFLGPNGLNGIFKTAFTEGVFTATINNPSTAFSSISFDVMNITTSGSNRLSSGFEHTMSVQYFKQLSDVHSSMFSQNLIPLEGYATPTATSGTFSGGDGYICYLSHLACGPRVDNPEVFESQPFVAGIRSWKGYLGYSRHNLNFRHQIIGEPGTYYHGKTDVRDLFSPSLKSSTPAAAKDILFDLTDSVNQLEYNLDYSRLNEFVVGTIWSPTLIQETAFPDTIITSPVQSEESKEFSWRTFLAGDSYVMPRNKGAILNTQGLNNNELLIHLEFGLFRTRTDAQQTVEGENIFFKSANIFDLPPEELFPSSGSYAGLKHRFGAILTKIGYCWVDDLDGKVFLYNGAALEEISANGERQFFRDFMQLIRGTSNYDNPFTQYGYTLGFDERFNRLIVSKKFADESWTKSYNPTSKTWTSYHDYIPDYLFQGLDNYLYALNNNTLFLTNYKPTATLKGVYFDATKYPSFIDIVHNEEPYRDKEAVAVQWVTEVYPNGMTSGQLNTTLDYTTTCTHLTLRTPQHCTGRIDLLLFDDIDSLYEANIRNLNRTWYFNDIRDIVTTLGFTLGFYENFDIDMTKLNINLPWYEQRRFIDKYVICRYEYDNQVNNRFIFLEDNVTFRYAVR